MFAQIDVDTTIGKSSGRKNVKSTGSQQSSSLCLTDHSDRTDIKRPVLIDSDLFLT